MERGLLRIRLLGAVTTSDLGLYSSMELFIKRSLVVLCGSKYFRLCGSPCAIWKRNIQSTTNRNKVDKTNDKPSEPQNQYTTNRTSVKFQIFGDSDKPESRSAIIEKGDSSTNYGFKPTSEPVEKLIYENTVLTRNHLTPELKLHLITPDYPLWHSNGDQSPFVDPFWAFYWPGGQALTRFILDNPDSVRDRCVLDVGSGCGASAIACKLMGAREVTANDIDQAAMTAIRLNAIANSVTLNADGSNMIGQFDSRWQVVLFGDMFYNTEFVATVFDWIKFLAGRNVDILIGDPGRLLMQAYSTAPGMSKIFETRLPQSCMSENNGLTHAHVWKYSVIDR